MSAEQEYQCQKCNRGWSVDPWNRYKDEPIRCPYCTIKNGTDDRYENLVRLILREGKARQKKLLKSYRISLTLIKSRLNYHLLKTSWK